MIYEDKTSKALSEHARKLNADGIGPVSKMCFESLLDNRNPREHAAEGGKFAALASTVAPPNLMGNYIRERSDVFPMTARLPAQFVQMAIQGCLHSTQLAGPPSAQYRYDAKATAAYLNFCGRNPDLFLSCFYLSRSLQGCVFELSEYLTPGGMKGAVDGFGAQFDATNVVTVLPLELYCCLTKIHGRDATIEQIDRGVVGDMMRSLAQKGLFITKFPGTNGSYACPMQAYLAELLIEYEPIQNIIAAIGRMNDCCHPESISRQNEAELRIHKENQRIVSRLSTDCYRHLRSAGFA